MLDKPDASVVAWLDQQAPESIWTSSVTVFEIRFGLAIMDAGSKQRRLSEAFEALLADDLLGRVLDFDADAAAQAAALSADLKKAGRPIEVRDSMICGIALARRARVATRNIRHFASTPVSIVNPWS